MIDRQEAAHETDKLQAFHWRQHKGKLGIALCLVIASASAYWAYSVASDRYSGLSRELQSKLDQAQVEYKHLLAQSSEYKNMANILEQKYASDAPHGATRQIMALVKERLESGVSPDRVAFLVAMAKNESGCEQNTDTRRFLLQTSLTTGVNSAVSFANDTITVTGRGSPSRDTNDNLQAWFDPAKKIEILFTLIGGEEHPVDGKLPLHHSVVSDNFEHRFTIKLGDARGFVVVTKQRCGFP